MISPSIAGAFGLLVGSLFSVAAAENVILFIGDGMGWDHVKAGRVLLNGSSAAPLRLEQLGGSASCITTLPNGGITDSATAATALATGYQHPVNSVVSVGYNGAIKPTILELARAKGLRTGIITTDDIGGATPGAFGAHELDRSYMANIRYDYLLDDNRLHHPASQPFVLLGGGYDDPTPVPGTGLSYAALAKNLGYVYARTASDLSAAPLQPLIGLFGSYWAPMSGMAYRPQTEPRLSEMVGKALAILENSHGFFLMAESANIDKFSHSNNPDFVYEVSELEAAVLVAVAWRNSHPDDHTLILVTADHETGGLSIPQQDLPPGTVPDMVWTSGGHTESQVPLFATWPDNLNGSTLDNTEVFFLMDDYLNLSSGGNPPQITDLSVFGITDTSATVQWQTKEPSSTLLYDGQNLIANDPARVTIHTVVCQGLVPQTRYQFTATSTDLAGYAGFANTTFETTGAAFTARVLAEPLVRFGSVSGDISGISQAEDGLVQHFTEAETGIGARLQVEYTLHTSAPKNSIMSILLDGVFSWSGDADSSEGLVTEIRVPLPDNTFSWQPISLPFLVTPPANFLDQDNNIVLRLSDAGLLAGERSDVLDVDSLLGHVRLQNTLSNPPAKPARLVPSLISGTAVTLKWPDVTNETSYLLWRNSAETGWSVIAELPAGAVSFTDRNLQRGASYTYALRAVNPFGYADSNPLVVRTRIGLRAPAPLKASSLLNGIQLSWQDPNLAETAYQVLRATTPDGNFTLLAGLPANSTAYKDKTTIPGYTYYYEVRALRPDEIGPVSTAAATALRSSSRLATQYNPAPFTNFTSRLQPR